MNEPEQSEVPPLQAYLLDLLQRDPMVARGLSTAVWALRVHHVASMYLAEAVSQYEHADQAVAAIKAMIHKRASSEPYMLQQLSLLYGTVVSPLLQHLLALEAGGNAVAADALAGTAPPAEFSIAGKQFVVPIGKCLAVVSGNPLKSQAYLESLYLYASANGYGTVYLSQTEDLPNSPTGTALPPSVWRGKASSRTQLTQLIMGVLAARGHGCQLLLVDSLLATTAGDYIGRPPLYMVKDFLRLVCQAAASVGAAVVGGVMPQEVEAGDVPESFPLFCSNFGHQILELDNVEASNHILVSEEQAEVGSTDPADPPVPE